MEKNIAQIIRIAKMYYEERITQEEIARKENISRPTVSRLLKEALNTGIVQIRVNDFNPEISGLESTLKEAFGMTEVLVASNEADICHTAADYLDRNITDNCSIGVSWGRTLLNVVNQVRPKHTRSGVTVLQLLGASGKSEDPAKANEIATLLASAYNGSYRILPAPLMVSNAKVRNMLIEESAISEVLQLSKRVDIALIGIGTSDIEISRVSREGYISRDGLNQLYHEGAVGEICCRFFRIDGTRYKHSIDDSIIGITLKELSTIPLRIGIAYGEKKVDAIIGAMNGEYINVLITDIQTAQRILTHNSRL